jgi:hypothetical protein
VYPKIDLTDIKFLAANAVGLSTLIPERKGIIEQN